MFNSYNATEYSVGKGGKIETLSKEKEAIVRFDGIDT